MTAEALAAVLYAKQGHLVIAVGQPYAIGAVIPEMYASLPTEEARIPQPTRVVAETDAAAYIQQRLAGMALLIELGEVTREQCASIETGLLTPPPGFHHFYRVESD